MATLAEDLPDRIMLIAERPFRLGAVQVTPALRQVAWNGDSRTIEPRVMQVLVALGRADGGIVGRDELIACCWDGRVVGENAINRVISLLRALAAETGAFEIETITKVGYRLKLAANSPVAAEEARRAQARPAIGRRAAFGLIGAAAVGGAGLLFWTDRLSPSRREAERHYRAGLDNERRGEAGVVQAIDDYERAVRADPEFATAWGALAHATMSLADRTYEADREPILARARLAARRALQLDPRNGDALQAQVLVEAGLGNWAMFQHRARAALAVRPELNLVRASLATSLANTGRLREALAEMRHVVAREPLMPAYQARLGWLLWQTGRVAEARRASDQAFRIWSGDIWVWTSRFLLLSLGGAAGEALDMIRTDYRAILGGPLPIPVATACAQALTPRAGSADRERAIDAIVAARATGDVASFITVMYLPALGRVDLAFDHAWGYLLGRRDTLSGERQPLPRHAARWTDFLFAASTAPMRADARFARLTAAIGLDDYWRATGSRPDYRAI